MSKTIIEKIVSGGQAGVDRAALDMAIEFGIPHGGWCPKGRWAEDAPIAEKYHLTEKMRQNALLILNLKLVKAKLVQFWYTQ